MKAKSDRNFYRIVKRLDDELQRLGVRGDEAWFIDPRRAAATLDSAFQFLNMPEAVVNRRLDLKPSRAALMTAAKRGEHFIKEFLADGERFALDIFAEGKRQQGLGTSALRPVGARLRRQGIIGMKRTSGHRSLWFLVEKRKRGKK